MAKAFSKIAKTTTVLQMEAAECGAAALAMVLRHYGLYLPLEMLRRDCGVSRDGSSARNIVMAARRYGLEAKGYSLSADQLASVPVPSIIHWEFNHFVVFEGCKGGVALINDPAAGHRRIPMNDFRKSYTGVVLGFKPGPDFKKGGKKFNVFAAVGEKLLAEKTTLAFVLLVGLMFVVPGLAYPVFNQIYIDDILSLRHTDWLTDLLLAMGLACVVEVVLTMLRNHCLVRWQAKLAIRDSANFFWHVIRLPMEFFQQRFSGEIAMRVGLNDAVAATLAGDAATVALDLFVALFFLVLLVQYSWQLTLIGLAFSFLNLLVYRLVRSRLLELSLRIQQDSGKVNAAVVNGLQSIETLKANGNEGDFFTKLTGGWARLLEGERKLQSYSQILALGPGIFSAVNTAMIMAVGGYQIMDGVMTAGVFMAFRSLMGNFQAPLGKLLGLGARLQETEVQMQRLDDVLEYPVDALHFPAEPVADNGIRRLDGAVSLEHLTFGYNPLQPPLLEDFHLDIKPGRWVALVGSSGSGKSTVSRLVGGMYAPWSGDILFDRIRRQEIPREVVVNSVACVFQEIYLFSGTVRENIALFDSAVSDADIIAAARDAEIHDVVAALEGGYDHRLTEGGSNLSGGQRQRIELARALALNPSFLILDEATSALDPVTEEKILRNIRRRGCSCLMVAHRLSAFRDCDEILVLDHGKPVQRGVHDEMFALDGPYRELVTGLGAGDADKGDAL